MVNCTECVFPQVKKSLLSFVAFSSHKTNIKEAVLTMKTVAKVKILASGIRNENSPTDCSVFLTWKKLESSSNKGSLIENRYQQQITQASKTDHLHSTNSRTKTLALRRQ